MHLSDFWKNYTNWLKNRVPNFGNALNPGATITEIEHLKQYFDFELSLEIQTLYQLNNGEQMSHPLGTFLGFTFLPIPFLLTQWKDWVTIAEEMDWADDYFGSSFPKKAIKIQYCNPKWIPIFYDFGGNYIGIDHDPDEHGTYGQVINFGRDEDDKFVIANNLTTFLKFVIAEIDNGHCNKAICLEEDGRYSIGLTPRSHLIDDLRSIILE